MGCEEYNVTADNRYMFSKSSVVMRLSVRPSCRGSECNGPSVQESCDQWGQVTGIWQRCCQSPESGCSDRFGGKKKKKREHTYLIAKKQAGLVESSVREYVLVTVFILVNMDACVTAVRASGSGKNRRCLGTLRWMLLRKTGSDISDQNKIALSLSVQAYCTYTCINKQRQIVSWSSCIFSDWRGQGLENVLCVCVCPIFSKLWWLWQVGGGINGVDERMFVPLWQNEQQETAMKALESLCENSRDDAQVLSALRSVRVQKCRDQWQHTWFDLTINM